MSAQSEIEQFSMFIDGAWCAAEAGGAYRSQDPFLGTEWAEVPDAASEDVDRAVGAARAALNGPWGELTGQDRARYLRRLGDVFARHGEDLAIVESRDNGRLLKDVQAQMKLLPDWYYYFASLAETAGDEVLPSGRKNFLVYTAREPVGVVGAIVPWNSPLWLITWKVAPALAAGCTMVLKPSDYTPVSALKFAELIEEAGLPPGVFNVVTGNGPKVGQALVAHEGVDKISFTGSVEVGIAVTQAAARNVTGVLLELGGKSAQIVFDDADIDAAVSGVISGVFAATGQTCMAGSRVLLQRGIHDRFVEKLVERTRRIKLGDPRAPDTELGPVANRGQFERILSFFDSARSDGATIAAGGKASSLGGLFIEPTVLTNTAPGMRVVDEEIFGPVVSVMSFDTEAEAVALANASDFGLAGAVWTNDIRLGHRVAGKLKAGTVWINAYRTLAPAVPFGGFKKSGSGRENGRIGLEEYTEVKSIWVELAGGGRDPFVIG